MPNLKPEADHHFVGVRDYLASALPHPEFEELHAGLPFVPILLVKAGGLMVGFAFSRDDIAESYHRLYSSFRDGYAERRAEWNAFDLAFVFCVSAAGRGFDLFSSEVETDAFFCRKYVIALEGNTAAALSRLPFLPLGPVAARSLRPPSAQTFLRQRGIPAPLARSLVVPGERSAQTIAERCLAGEFGSPVRVGTGPSELVPVTTEDAAPVRLEEIRIRSFRAYRKEQSLAFGQKLTFLYGPNGFGKTSVFDAIDFAATGDIGRLRIGTEERFRKTATHLDGDDRQSEVVLTVGVRGETHRLCRSVGDRKRACLDDEFVGRKEVLRYLTGGRGPAADHVDNLVSLFRATHLFSQEHQELAKNFARDCELSSEVVSRLLAFEDYLNARKKTTEVCRVFRERVAEASREIAHLLDAVRGEEEELERLGRAPSGPVAESELGEAIAAVTGRVAAAGVAVKEEEVDLERLRGWRATFESRIASLARRRLQVRKLADDVGELPAAMSKLLATRQDLQSTEKRLAARLTDRTEREQRVNAATAAVAEQEERRSSCRTRIDGLAWLRRVMPEYAALRARLNAATTGLTRARAALAEAQAGENRARAGATEARRRRTESTDGVRGARSRLQLLDELVSEMRDWTVQRDRFAVARAEETAVATALDRLAAEHAAVTEDLRTSRKREAQYRADAERTGRAHSEMGVLLTAVEEHIDSGTCPLCGTDHGAAAELIAAIRRRRNRDAPGEAGERLRNVRNEINELTQRTAELETDESAKRTQLAAIQEQRLVDEGRNAAFLERLKNAGVVHRPEAGPTEQLLALRETQLGVVGECERELEAAVENEAATAVALRESGTRVERGREALAEHDRVMSEAGSRMEALRNDPRATGEDLEAGGKSIGAAEETSRRELEEAEHAYEDAKKTLAKERALLNGINTDAVSIRSELAFYKARETELAELCRRVEAGVEKLRIRSGVDRNGVLSLASDLTRRLAELEDLREDVDRVEMALDAATTQAAFRRLQASVRRRREAIDAAEKQRYLCGRWLDGFEEIAKMLTAEQETAVEHFTREYGPRTSVIQQRLRSVYGFGEIEILSEDSRIKVRARRGSVDDLRPTDYFSQSQQQTLLLGLFLTACVSQTWSALAPVFLDDPLTHFDDLNAYAFLDLVRGLLESGTGTQQFVISSCDERFYELAREKFRYLGDQARFYRFTGMGKEGPEVSIPLRT